VMEFVVSREHVFKLAVMLSFLLAGSLSQIFVSEILGLALGIIFILIGCYILDWLVDEAKRGELD